MYERRQATRMRAPPNQDQIILRLLTRDLIGRLRDESSRGMAVLCAEPPEVQAGDELKIRTPVGWYAAKVIRVSSSPEGTVVGLTRGCELARERDFIGGQGISRWTLVLALASGLLVIPVVTLFWPRSAPQAKAKSPAPHSVLAARPAGSLPSSNPPNPPTPRAP